MASVLLGVLPITPRSPISFSQSKILGTSVSYSVSLSTTHSPSIPFSWELENLRLSVNHSFCNAMRRDRKRVRGPPGVMGPSAPPRKVWFDDEEKIHIEID